MSVRALVVTIMAAGPCAAMFLVADNILRHIQLSILQVCAVFPGLLSSVLVLVLYFTIYKQNP